MPVVAIINRKGGSGKSTLATHVAGHLASRGVRVMLGDVDQQQSSLAWLRRREAQSLVRPATVVGWATDAKSVLRPPAGITHVVLDTPGGLRGLDLARVVMQADAILIPVCNSSFDRESTVECHAELMTLPRLSSGRCKIGIVGMRLDARTRAGEQLEQWATRRGFHYVGGLRETQTYVRCADQGLTIFDLPQPKLHADLSQWTSITEWLESVWRIPARHDPAPAASLRAPPTGTAAGVPRMATVPGSLLPTRPLGAVDVGRHPGHSPRPSLADRLGGLLGVFKSPP